VASNSRLFAQILLAITAVFLLGCTSRDIPHSVTPPEANSSSQLDSPASQPEDQNADLSPISDSVTNTSDEALPKKTQLAPGGFVADEVIAILVQGSTLDDARTVASDVGAQLIEWIPELLAAELRFAIPDSRIPSFKKAGEYRLVSGLDSSDVPELDEYIEKIQLHPSVRLAEPHYYGSAASDPVTPNDPYFNDQYYIIGTYIDYVWGSTTGSSDLTVAIIDTGVDYDHPEFAGRIHPEGGDFISPPHDDDPSLRGDGGATPGNGIDEDGNGDADDGAQHGSRVAGVLCAAGNNTQGIAGVDWNVRIMSLRVDSLVGESKGWLVIDCIRAMMHTLKYPEVRIINISAVYPKSQKLLAEATSVCADYGKIVIAAAGNAGEESPQLCAPAYYPEAIAVGGTKGISDIWNEATEGTNYGEFLDILAPATSILTVNSDGETRTYASVDGTSLSAPLISGLASLILSEKPGYTLDDVRTALMIGAKSFDDKYPELAGKLGAGLVNAYQAFWSPSQIDLELLGVRTDGISHLDIFFNRALDPYYATDVSHYSILPQKYIYRAVLMDDGKRVRLESDPLFPGGWYELSVNTLLASDGATQSPDSQSTSFTADSHLYSPTVSSFGATARADSEFDSSHSPARAIDESPTSFWYAELIDSSPCEIVIELPQSETLNWMMLSGRTMSISDPPYSQTLRIFASGVYDPALPILAESYIPIIDESAMTDGELVLIHNQAAMLSFPLVQARYIIIRFTDGNDSILDSDGIDNGVSLAQILTRRNFSSEDIYAPMILNITPNNAPIGATVEIHGESFGASASGNTITFGDVEAVPIDWTDTLIRVLVPYNPLSLPVELPPAIPPDAETDQNTGDPPPYPQPEAAIIPPFSNAESGPVCILRDGFVSNLLHFTVTE